MLTIALDGVEALDAALAAYPKASPRRSPPRLTHLPLRSPTKFATKSSPAKSCNPRSGALAASIAAEVAADGENIIATIGSSGVKYAAIQEYGGQTAAHEILPSKAAALAFVIDGATHFARRVEHPGSIMPERSYLRSSLEEMSEQIVAEFSSAAMESWGTSSAAKPPSQRYSPLSPPPIPGTSPRAG